MPPKQNFDWQQYIEFAEALSNTSQNNECIMRNIISRSYYGAFCLSREFALRTGWIINEFSGADSHNKVIDAFYNSDYKTKMELESQNVYQRKRAVGEYLRDLKKYRVAADYENIYPSSNGRTLERDSKFAVKYANMIKNIISEL
jgi:formylmethanofuran dehydrogenase subunit A